jgi:osmoprotectant transport system permease protein
MSTDWTWLGREVLVRTQEHVLLTLLAMGAAAAIAVPAGVALARCRSRRIVGFAMGVISVIQPIPSLALVALIMVLFKFCGLPTIGLLPGLTALLAYAVLPVLRNTYTGVRQVDPAVREVAVGMGMAARDILFRVELPLALPVIMTGVRIATVWTIGVATLVSLVGAGGLGDLIFKGLRNYRVDLVLAGAGPAAALALVFDGLLERLERWLTPRGLRDDDTGVAAASMGG